MTKEKQAIEYIKKHRELDEKLYNTAPKGTVSSIATNKCLEFWDMAIKALEQEPMVEIDLDYVIKQKYIEREVLDKIRTEIEQKIEQERFARSVFRGEEKDTVKAEQCTGSIFAYNNVIKLIDKYMAESEDKEWQHTKSQQN